MSIKFVRKHRPRAVVDMAPMIDIVFQLIIFFMVATTFKSTTGMELKLPGAKNVSQISESPLKITINSRDKIIIGDMTVNIDELVPFIEESAKTGKNDRKSAIVYGDKSVDYETIIDVMDILRGAGFDNLELAVEKKR